MSALLLGILSLISGGQQYTKDTLQTEITGGGGATITFPEGTPLVSSIAVTTPITAPEYQLPLPIQAERIAAIDVKVPEYVKERWTPEERKGAVVYGREEEIWKEYKVERVVSGVTIIDV